MKKLAMVLLLAGSLKADIVGPMSVQQLDNGAIWPLSGSLTYALNQALTGTGSTAIDLSGSNGLMVSLTGTSIVTVYFSNANVSATAGSLASYQLQSPGAYRIPARGRYVSFYNSGKIPTGTVSAFYYLETPIGGTSAPISALVGITSTPSLNPISFTAYTVTSATATTVNLTTSAGASVPCVICLSSDGGAAAGFKVGFNQSATPPAIMSGSGKGHYIAASTTAQCWGPFTAGTHAHMVGVAASSSVIVEVDKVQ